MMEDCVLGFIGMVVLMSIITSDILEDVVGMAISLALIIGVAATPAILLGAIDKHLFLPTLAITGTVAVLYFTRRWIYEKN